MLFGPLATDIINNSSNKPKLQKQQLLKKESYSSLPSPPAFPDSDIPSTSTSDLPTERRPNSIGGTSGCQHLHSPKTRLWQKLGKDTLVKALSADEIELYIHATEPEKRKLREEDSIGAKEFCKL
jgi:hypothetical protein